MSKLINMKNNRNDFRRRLLTTVSALALIGSLSATPDANASDDADRPTIWIELGGQLERMDGTGDPYAPAFIAAYPNSDVFHPVSPSQADKAPLFAIGGESSISFEPAGTDWVLSAAVLFGRSNKNRNLEHQVTPSAKYVNGFGTKQFGTGPFAPMASGLATIAKFAETRAQQRESHTIVDFRAGKDVGLGMFGKEATSILSLGVRFAQFASHNHVNIEARPDLAGSPSRFNHFYFHVYTASGQSDRDFHGVGPSLSWKASAAVVGSHDDGEIALDWGVNAALLFGRQKASTVHSTLARFHNGKYYHTATAVVYSHAANPVSRIRSVTVPNVGGFAGISFVYPNAKVSFGYRGEIFFGAVDGGWDTAHKDNLSFHGPYVTVSIGLGG